MRAVKSVLVMAGGLKRANPELPEDVVLIRAMRDSNLPKFLTHDMELFCNIIADLFPGLDVPNQVGGTQLCALHVQKEVSPATRIIQISCCIVQLAACISAFLEPSCMEHREY
jgi:hypothetical protein